MCPYCDEYGMPPEWAADKAELARLRALVSETLPTRNDVLEEAVVVCQQRIDRLESWPVEDTICGGSERLAEITGARVLVAAIRALKNAAPQVSDTVRSDRSPSANRDDMKPPVGAAPNTTDGDSAVLWYEPTQLWDGLWVLYGSSTGASLPSSTDAPLDQRPPEARLDDLVSKRAVIESIRHEAAGWYKQKDQVIGNAVSALEANVLCLSAASARNAPTIRGFKEQDADMMAACIDAMVYAGHLDARSELADIRLDYGQPFSDEEIKMHLARRRHGGTMASSDGTNHKEKA